MRKTKFTVTEIGQAPRGGVNTYYWKGQFVIYIRACVHTLNFRKEMFDLSKLLMSGYFADQMTHTEKPTKMGFKPPTSVQPNLILNKFSGMR